MFASKRMEQAIGAIGQLPFFAHIGNEVSEVSSRKKMGKNFECK